MNNLIDLETLFEKKLFRIPDYQRGYSWGKTQVYEFWNDLRCLLPEYDHYTGMLSLDLVRNSEILNNANDWLNEQWLVDDEYSIYRIVDGQQRITTMIILINEIVNYCEKNNIPHIVDEALTISKIKEKYLYKIQPNGIINTCKFGYEKNNPSNNYFKTKILGLKENAEIEETLYTVNLENAKTFFSEEIAKLTSEELADVYKKLTKHLKFTIYYIEEKSNAYLAFETINNRGKKLSYSELLKNRLVYLSTIITNNETSQKQLRMKINNTWKKLYKYFGKLTKDLAPDDEFLQHHWIIYFGYQTRKTTDNRTIPFYDYLLKVYFKQENTNASVNYLSDILEESYTEEFIENQIEENENNEVFEDKSVENSEKIKLTFKDIWNYTDSLFELIPYWHQTYDPNEANNFEITKYLFRLSKLGYVNSRPLITVILSKKDLSDDIKIKCLKLIERYNFLHYRLNGYSSSHSNSEFYNLARDLYHDKIDINYVIEVVSKIEYLADNKVVGTDGIIDRFTKLFKREGFYWWGSIKYLLYIYDISDNDTPSEQQLNIDVYFIPDTKSSYSIEHIYPQKATDGYWTSRFNMYSEKERKRLTNSLGNLLPLSNRDNSSLRNYSFDIKKKTYLNGSKSEIKVGRKDEWTPNEIMLRGLELLKFMEEEFDFNFPNDAYRKRVLGLEFMINDEEDYLNSIEPEYAEKEKDEATREFNEKQFSILKEIASPETIKIYEEIEAYCLNLGENVTRNTTLNYINFYDQGSFLRFYFYKEKISLLIRTIKYDDPQNKTYILAQSYNWTNKTKIDIYPGDDLEYVKNIIKQSYEAK